MSGEEHLLNTAHALLAPVLSRAASWTGLGGDAAWWARRRAALIPGGAVWVHGSSAGESAAAARLGKALSVPCWRTTSTRTGHMLTGAEPAPLDHRPFAQPPAGLILVEGELWPGWLMSCRRSGVPVAVLGATMSAPTADRWALARGWFQQLMSPVGLVGCVSGEVARRFIDLGIDDSRVEVTGPLKGDGAVTTRALGRVSRWGLPPGTLCLASSHEEEEALLGLPQIAGERVVVVPRYPERAIRVSTFLQARGWTVTRSSALSGPWVDDGVLLVDEIGLLDAIYRHVGLVLLGQNPQTGGLHDPLAPLRLGLPLAVRPTSGRWSGLVAEGAAAGVVQRLSGQAGEAARELMRWRQVPPRAPHLSKELHERYDGFFRNLELIQQHPDWSVLRSAR